jgi:hypothetical protein
MLGLLARQRFMTITDVQLIAKRSHTSLCGLEVTRKEELRARNRLSSYRYVRRQSVVHLGVVGVHE